MDPKNPSVQPKATRAAVTEAKTYPIVKVEKIVRTMLRDEKRITRAPVPIAIAAAVYAEVSMLPFISYHQ
jgi:hypothetical protein